MCYTILHTYGYFMWCMVKRIIFCFCYSNLKEDFSNVVIRLTCMHLWFPMSACSWVCTLNKSVGSAACVVINVSIKRSFLHLFLRLFHCCSCVAHCIGRLFRACIYMAEARQRGKVMRKTRLDISITSPQCPTELPGRHHNNLLTAVIICDPPQKHCRTPALTFVLTCSSREGR